MIFITGSTENAGGQWSARRATASACALVRQQVVTLWTTG
jgi:hypothetical protein